MTVESPARNIPHQRFYGIFFARPEVSNRFDTDMKNNKRNTLRKSGQRRQNGHRTASALYLATGLGALATAVGMMLCGKRSRALLLAQWVAPLLMTAANERLACRKRARADR